MLRCYCCHGAAIDYCCFNAAIISLPLITLACHSYDADADAIAAADADVIAMLIDATAFMPYAGLSPALSYGNNSGNA